MTETPAKKSDLGVRTLSAVVMVAVAGTALWLGGWVWALFVALVACGVLWEWRGLVRGFAKATVHATIWNAGGFVYIALASAVLLYLRGIGPEPGAVTLLVGTVIATDVGAYFAGRTFGGPKIAPAISPSKTWSGLGGGILGAAGAVYLIFGGYQLASVNPVIESLGMGAPIAIVAQTGDFFESWMKRRAGVKDSGNLIPGHGGLFDRVDGLLAVSFVIGLITLAATIARP